MFERLLLLGASTCNDTEFSDAGTQCFAGEPNEPDLLPLFHPLHGQRSRNSPVPVKSFLDNFAAARHAG